VDDVLAVAAALAQQPYVDAEQIDLGGHNTGATLALLATQMSSQFAARFAFGAVAIVDSYAAAFEPIGLSDHDPRELSLRSPIHWLAGDVRARLI
jgi:dienelactone hydrolase